MIGLLNTNNRGNYTLHKQYIAGLIATWEDKHKNDPESEKLRQQRDVVEGSKKFIAGMITNNQWIAYIFRNPLYSKPNYFGQSDVVPIVTECQYFYMKYKDTYDFYLSQQNNRSSSYIIDERLIEFIQNQ